MTQKNLSENRKTRDFNNVYKQNISVKNKYCLTFKTKSCRFSRFLRHKHSRMCKKEEKELKCEYQTIKIETRE